MSDKPSDESIAEPASAMARGGPGPGEPTPGLASPMETGGVARGRAGITGEKVGRLRSLIDVLEGELPLPYRVEAFRLLARRVLGDIAPPDVQPDELAPSRPAAAIEGEQSQPPGALEGARLDVGPYAAILARPGRTTLKGLVALEIALSQLGITWMTPAEIERLLSERCGVRSIYRTNLSSGLGEARGLVDRRRRGRGFEYRIAAQGRETLRRELALGGE